MTENDFGVVVPDPRNIHISHLDATLPENELLVAEGILEPPKTWLQQHKLAMISLTLTVSAFICIILGVMISLSALNDTGQPLGTMGFVLLCTAFIVSIAAVFKDKTPGPAWASFAASLLPVLSMVAFSVFTMMKIHSTLGS